MTSTSLIIVTDRGSLKAYKVNDTPNRGASLQLVQAFDLSPVSACDSEVLGLLIEQGKAKENGYAKRESADRAVIGLCHNGFAVVTWFESERVAKCREQALRVVRFGQKVRDVQSL